jgi:hypothetical protein
MIGLIVPSACLMACLLGHASAARTTGSPAPSCPAVDAPAPAAPRVRAFVDPVTGALREPTADELRRLAEERRAAREAAPPRVFVIVEHPDGMKSVDLGDAFLFDVKLETLPDGSPKITCVPRSGAPANPSK